MVKSIQLSKSTRTTGILGSDCDRVCGGVDGEPGMSMNVFLTRRGADWDWAGWRRVSASSPAASSAGDFHSHGVAGRLGPEFGPDPPPAPAPAPPAALTPSSGVLG